MEEERLIVVKITFGDDLRRVSLPLSQFTFQSLQQTIERLFPENQQPVTLKYKDEEGDLITFKSEEETAEALRQLRPNDIFRLTVSIPSQPKNEAKRKEENHPHPHPHPHPWSWRRRWCRRAARRQQHIVDKIEEAKKEQKCTFSATGKRYAPQTFMHCYTCGLVGNLGCCEVCASNCHEGHELSDPIQSPAFFCDCGAGGKCARLPKEEKEEEEKKVRGKCGKGGGRRRCGGWRMGAFFRAHREALRLISSSDASDVEEGRKLLLAMLESVPGHIVTTYNLACAESLLGNVKEAVQTLKRAVELGYRNVEHMVADADFANIREMDEFKAIVSFLRGDDANAYPEKEESQEEEEEEEEEEVKEEVVEESKKEEEKNEVVIQDVKEEEEEEEEEKKEEEEEEAQHPFARSLAVMKSMGFNNERENIERLIKHRGDLIQAVNELLQGQ